MIVRCVGGQEGGKGERRGGVSINSRDALRFGLLVISDVQYVSIILLPHLLLLLPLLLKLEFLSPPLLLSLSLLLSPPLTGNTAAVSFLNFPETLEAIR